MKSSTLRSFSLLGLLALAAASQAVAVSYTLNGVLSGSLNGIGFTDVPSTIVGVGDTDDLQIDSGGVQTLVLQSLTVSGSFGSATYLTPSRAFLARDSFGFSLLSEFPGLPGLFFYSDAFTVYDPSIAGARLDRALPLRSVSGFSTDTAEEPNLTTAGVLRVNALSSATFGIQGGLTPSAVPGPLAALPFALMAIKRRRAVRK